jgi:hypothetical protein
MITPFERSISRIARRTSGFCRRAVRIAWFNVKLGGLVDLPDRSLVLVVVVVVDPSFEPAHAKGASVRIALNRPRIRKCFRIESVDPEVVATAFSCSSAPVTVV